MDNNQYIFSQKLFNDMKWLEIYLQPLIKISIQNK